MGEGFVSGAVPMVKIPEHIETVPPEASARLLEKQWRARIALRTNLFAYALNLQWRAHFNKSTSKLEAFHRRKRIEKASNFQRRR